MNLSKNRPNFKSIEKALESAIGAGTLLLQAGRLELNQELARGVKNQDIDERFEAIASAADCEVSLLAHAAAGYIHGWDAQGVYHIADEAGVFLGDQSDTSRMLFNDMSKKGAHWDQAMRKLGLIEGDASRDALVREIKNTALEFVKTIYPDVAIQKDERGR